MGTWPPASVDGLRRVLGEEHMCTVIAMNNLAVALTETGEYSEAASLFRLRLEIEERKPDGERASMDITRRRLAEAERHMMRGAAGASAGEQ